MDKGSEPLKELVWR
jgi:hypothetical protein